MTPSLSDNGYVVLPGFIHQRMAETLYHMLIIREWRGESKRDGQVPGAASFWGDSTLDAVLLSLLPDLERASGWALLPTYCYARLYLHGDFLARHRDRDACELAATIHLGHRGTEPPPICFGGGVAVRQRPGDAVVYLGTKIDHWRDAFQGENFGQLFVNYVRADGPNRHHALDRRHGSFPPSLIAPEPVGRTSA